MLETRSKISCCILPATALLLAGAAAPTEAQFRDFGWTESGPLLRSDETQVPGGCPIESPGGRYLYTVKGTGGGSGINVRELWVNARDSLESAYDQEDVLDAVNDFDFADFCPTPLPDGELLFVSNRGGDCGDSVDIYETRNHPATGWSTPTSMGCHPHGPNTPGTELSPSVIETWFGTFLFYSSNYNAFSGEIGDQDIYVSFQRADGSFGRGYRLDYPINTYNYDDQQPNLSADGREIVFSSNRPSSSSDDTGFDIFYGKSRALFLLWRNVTNLSETVPFADTLAANETRPALSWDGKRMYYGSGGVWISER